MSKRKDAPPPPVTAETYAERTKRNLYEYEKLGLSIGAIAKREGTSRTAVRRRLADAGCKFRGVGQRSPAERARIAQRRRQKLVERAARLALEAQHILTSTE